MRKLTKKLVSLGLVTAMAVTLAACGGTGNDKGTSGDKEGKVDKFVIGGMGPLSGENASYGTSVKQGAEIAIKEINDNGGINGTTFELNFLDDQADPEAAQNALNKVLDENANAILGAVTSGACLGITDITAEEGILQVTPSGSAKEITANDNVFRICFTDPIQGTKMADYVVDDLKLKNVAIIYDVSNDYSAGMTDAFIKQLESKGGVVVAKESFTKGDVDFNTQLTTIKGKNPDVIFVPTYYQQVASILKQAQKLGMEVPFVGGDGWDGVLDQLGEDAGLADGAIFLSPFIADDEAAAVKNFVDKYKAAYKATPDQFAADAYDGVYAIAKAYEKAGSTDSAALIKAMTEIEVDGSTGKMTFDENGEPNKEAKFIQIQDGKYTMAK